jgi:outer membrane protein OmpA-like peptidoglycan-associated protein
MDIRYRIPLAALALAFAPAPALAEQRIDSIHFESKSSTVSDIGKAILDEVAIAAKRREYTSVWIDSNTDASPPAAALKLSRRMGDAVAAYLKAQGADPKRIKVAALGSTRPVVATPQSDADRLRNRYVNVTINWK